ncbi:hypothetical protein KAR48_16670, partial [bacterium]|nr:hypothetical protein [bacterium]
MRLPSGYKTLPWPRIDILGHGSVIKTKGLQYRIDVGLNSQAYRPKLVYHIGRQKPTPFFTDKKNLLVPCFTNRP